MIGSIEQSASREANCHSNSQEISSHLLNTIFKYNFEKNSLMACALSRMQIEGALVNNFIKCISEWRDSKLIFSISMSLNRF
jgi:hypothetical protein